MQYLGHIAFVVKNYDEAIEFFIEKLDFQLVEDTKLTDDKRWIIVAPPGSRGCSLLLAKAANEKQKSAIGNQSGGRVFLFLYTDDFWADHAKFTKRGVTFVRPPAEEAFGTVGVFKDLYGNLWDLIERK
jgi:catechol 2,3-dioxygenase-like lactoylglutathione lyase family enzyme